MVKEHWKIASQRSGVLNLYKDPLVSTTITQYHLFPQQVNGTMVANSSHLEVVKLIKCELGRTDHERIEGSS